MSSLNRCEFIGNLGGDPEVRTLNNGDPVCNISVACTDRWKDKHSGERRDKTEWVRVVIDGSLAGIAEKYLSKGSKVYVSGRLQTRKWQDQSGNDRYSTEIVLSGFDAKLIMLDPPNGAGGSSSGYTESEYRQASSGGGPTQHDDEMDSEIPF